MLKRIALALLDLAFAWPAAALDLQSTTAPGRTVPSLGNGEIAINRADRNLFYKTVDGTIGVGSLLSALPAGRKAVEQGDASDLKARPTDALVSRLLSDRFRDSLVVLDDLASALDGSAAINGAIAKAVARGGGQVLVPNVGLPYTLSAKIVIPSGVELVGAGRPTLRLANGVNDNLVETQNWPDLIGGGAIGQAPGGFAVRGIILDGNRDGNSSPPVNAGHCAAIFGRDFLLEDLFIRNCGRRGLHTQYGPGGTSPYNGRVAKVTVSNTGEENWLNRVSDLHWTDFNGRFASQNSSGGFDQVVFGTGGNARGQGMNLWTNFDAPAHPRCVLTITTDAVTATSIHVEAGKVSNICVSGNNNQLSDVYSYNNLPGSTSNIDIQGGKNNRLRMSVDPGAYGDATAKGVVVRSITSDAGVTTFPTGNVFDLRVSGYTGGLLDLSNAGANSGDNRIAIQGFLASGTALLGAPRTTDALDLNVSGAAGITLASHPVNTLAAAGMTQTDATAITRSIVRATSSSASAGLRLPAMWPGSDVRVFNVSGTALLLYPPVGRAFYGVATNGSIGVAAGGSVLVTELGGLLGVMRGQ